MSGATHRDADGRVHVGATRESLVERLIREAQERGEFDRLTRHGQPLPAPEHDAGEWEMAFSILRNAGVAPRWIEADREARELLAERDALLERAQRAGPLARGHLRRRIEAIVRAHRHAVEVLAAEAPSPRLHRRPLSLERELALLDRIIQEGAPRP
jgi:hypothetical protein